MAAEKAAKKAAEEKAAAEKAAREKAVAKNVGACPARGDNYTLLIMMLFIATTLLLT